MNETVGTKQCDINEYTAKQALSWMPTNQRPNCGRRLALSPPKSNSLGLFSYSRINRIAGLSNRHLKP